MPTSTTVDEISSGYVVVGHFNDQIDLVSACMNFSADSGGDYLNIWSIVTENNSSVNASASLELEADDVYSECLAVSTVVGDGDTYALLRNVSDGAHTLIKLNVS